MTKPITRIYQGDGTFIDREMNDDEYAQYQIDQEAAAQRQAEAEAKAAEKQALLDRLGISADEAKLLLG
jgi:hypothetical protein